MSTTVYSQVRIYTADSTGASVERTKMPILRNGSKRGSNPGSLDCESGVLPLSYRAPHDDATVAVWAMIRSWRCYSGSVGNDQIMTMLQWQCGQWSDHDDATVAVCAMIRSWRCYSGSVCNDQIMTMLQWQCVQWSDHDDATVAVCAMIRSWRCYSGSVGNDQIRNEHIQLPVDNESGSLVRHPKRSQTETT